MVNYSNLIIKMSPHFVLGRENVPCVAEAVNRSLKADCTDFTTHVKRLHMNYDNLFMFQSHPRSLKQVFRAGGKINE